MRSRPPRRVFLTRLESSSPPAALSRGAPCRPTCHRFRQSARVDSARIQTLGFRADGRIRQRRIGPLPGLRRPDALGATQFQHDRSRGPGCGGVSSSDHWPRPDRRCGRGPRLVCSTALPRWLAQGLEPFDGPGGLRGCRGRLSPARSLLDADTNCFRAGEHAVQRRDGVGGGNWKQCACHLRGLPSPRCGLWPATWLGASC